MKKLILGIFVVFSSCASTKNVSKRTLEETPVTYTLNMPKPQTHYFEVEMEINTAGKDSVLVKMPVWAPGSYLVREFARHVEGFQASGENGDLKSQKINKNTWVVKTNKNAKVKVKYAVYANEISVRTSFIDIDHGYLNGTSVFMYVPEYKNAKQKVKINLFNDWKTISTGLDEVEKNTFMADNYDILVDSPIEMGNQKVLTFELGTIKHEIAMVGNYKMDNETKFIEDMKTVTKNATSIFGENPCKKYVFIVQHYPSSPLVNGGGLEHLNSTTLIVRPESYSNERGYRGMLSLTAHEYFHLWNVKRIRPTALGPFDYDNENYTTLLWVSEGITSFFQDYILRKGNQITEKDYLDLQKEEIAAIENQPGNKIQTVAESSFDAWIKYYRQNENSKNSTISYYDKGGVIGAMLNLLIIEKTNGNKNLEDAFKILWNNYKKTGKGFTENDFKQAIETVSGENLDSFFEKIIHSTNEIEYNNYLQGVGLQLVSSEIQTPSLGIGLAGTKITSVLRNSSAWEAGLNTNDEIIDIDGIKVINIIEMIASKKVGDQLTFKVKRFGSEKTIKVELLKNINKNFEIKKIDNPTPQQEKNYKKWLFLN